MMTQEKASTANRDELSDELAAAGEYTGDWETAELADLRERVVRLLKGVGVPIPPKEN